MDSDRPKPPQPPFDDHAERAARIRAMLTRWQAETVADEPEWDIDDLEPMRIGSHDAG